MSKATEEHAARLAVLSIALQEVCGLLTTTQTDHLAAALQSRVARLPPLHGAADAAPAGELRYLLEALTQRWPIAHRSGSPVPCGKRPSEGASRIPLASTQEKPC